MGVPNLFVTRLVKVCSLLKMMLVTVCDISHMAVHTIIPCDLRSSGILRSIITTECCVMSEKRADLIYFAAQACNHTPSFPVPS